MYVIGARREIDVCERENVCDRREAEIDAIRQDRQK